MGCAMCGYTGFEYEYDETVGPGYIEVPCRFCWGINGEEPDIISEAATVLMQEDIEAEAHTMPRCCPQGAGR